MPLGAAFDISAAENSFAFHLLNCNVEKEVKVFSRQGQYLSQPRRLLLAVEATSILTFGVPKRNLPGCCVGMVHVVG